MRQIFLIFAASFTACWTLSGQSEASTSVVYQIDTIATDSFYFLQITFVPSGGKRDTIKDYFLFRDTVELKNYRDNLKQRLDGLEDRIRFLRLEYDSLSSRYNRVDNLVQQVINFVGGGVEFQILIFDTEPANQGFQFYIFCDSRRRRRKPVKKQPY